MATKVSGGKDGQKKPATAATNLIGELKPCDKKISGTRNADERKQLVVVLV